MCETFGFGDVSRTVAWNSYPSRQALDDCGRDLEGTTLNPKPQNPKPGGERQLKPTPRRWTHAFPKPSSPSVWFLVHPKKDPKSPFDRAQVPCFLLFGDII